MALQQFDSTDGTAYLTEQHWLQGVAGDEEPPVLYLGSGYFIYMQDPKILTALLVDDRLDLKLLQKIVSTNRVQELSQIARNLFIILSRYPHQEIKPQLQISDSLNSYKSLEQLPIFDQQRRSVVLGRLTEDDVFTLLTVLKILAVKLKGTRHQWTVRQTSLCMVENLRLMPGFNLTRKLKDLLDVQVEKSGDLEKQSKLKQLVGTNQLFEGLQSILCSFVSLVDIYEFLVVSLLPAMVDGLQSLKTKDRPSYLMSCCKLLQRFIPPLQLEVEVEKNALTECRRYQPVFEREFLKYESRISRAAARILNEMILSPSEVQLQKELFVLLRRMYYLWGQPIQNPLNSVIRSISLHSKSEADMKQIAMFSYRLIQDRVDLYLGIQIQNSEGFKFLKESPYFSSKAYALLDEEHCYSSTTDINLPFWKLQRSIQCGEVQTTNILVEKGGSLICWQFSLKAHDIRFGLYKVEDVEKLGLPDYQQQKSCKAILKLQKYAYNKSGHKGCLLLKPGLYRQVFDNSYSYLRSKELVSCLTVLEPV